ncbi:hypothetical protein AB0M46_36240 [Dactylosporangium sp. NPDC051485]|uniref:hypothetical protein n=1 Tax=Dactylosporangium sp. NPDC051485 TaxID=3154846 RepID=UPI00343DCAA9
MEAMDKPGANEVQDELLELATVRLQALMTEPDSATSSTLDSVMRRLFNPKERDLLTVSAFSSAL